MPPDERRFFVNAYTDIFKGCFPTAMVNRLATGEELHRFLVTDARLLWGDGIGRFLQGDLVLWHLGLSPGYGCLLCEDRLIVWRPGQASFDLVKQFVDALHADSVFNQAHHATLCHLINQARGFGHQTGLRAYLEAREENQPCLSSCCNSMDSKPCCQARPCRATW